MGATYRQSQNDVSRQTLDSIILGTCSVYGSTHLSTWPASPTRQSHSFNDTDLFSSISLLYRHLVIISHEFRSQMCRKKKKGHTATTTKTHQPHTNMRRELKYRRGERLQQRQTQPKKKKKGKKKLKKQGGYTTEIRQLHRKR